MKRWLFSLLFLMLLSQEAAALLPAPGGFVNDFAEALSPAVEQRLEGILASFAQQASIEVVVATIGSLEERPVEDFAVDLFSAWGIGKKGKDDGVLFLIAPAERKMRIEVGYGLEGGINDAKAGRLLDTFVVPHFRQGNLEAGVVAGVEAIIGTLIEAYDLPFEMPHQLVRPNEAAQKRPIPWGYKLLFAIVMLYLFIRHPWLFLFFIGRGGGRFGGGGFPGGFRGFGGGRSGGGGASRGW